MADGIRLEIKRSKRGIQTDMSRRKRHSTKPREHYNPSYVKLGKIDRDGSGGRWNRHPLYNKKKYRAPWWVWCLIILSILSGLAALGIVTYQYEQLHKEDSNVQAIQSEKGKSAVTNSQKNQSKEEVAAKQLEQKVLQRIESMPLPDKIAQLFLITPEELTGTAIVVQAGEATKTKLQTFPVGGLIYFEKNVEDQNQLKTMLANTKGYSKYPIFLGVEEEGGDSLSRIANSGHVTVPQVSNMIEIGKSGDIKKAAEVGTTVGSYLSELGFNLNFAPNADVIINNENTTFASRSFGSDAQMVGSMVTSLVKAMQKEKISAVLKYFPGQGDVLVDNQNGSYVSQKTWSQLKEMELIPFDAGIQAGADMIMVGHVSFPNINGDYTPASIAPAIVTDILRNQLNYEGIVITDALNVESITGICESSDIGVRVIQAGGDMILMPEDFQAAYTGLLSAVQSGVISQERIDESLSRIYRVKLRE